MSLILIPALLLFGNYFFVVRSIDIAMLYFISFSVPVFILMVLGIIPGYYRKTYDEFVNVMLLISIFIWSALPRLIVYYGLFIMDYVSPESRYEFISAKNILSDLYDFNIFMVFVFISSVVLFISMFFKKTDIPFYKVHFVARMIRGNKKIKKINKSFGFNQVSVIKQKPNDEASNVSSTNLINRNTEESVPEVVATSPIKDEVNDNYFDDLLLKRTSR